MKAKLDKALADNAKENFVKIELTSFEHFEEFIRSSVGTIHYSIKPYESSVTPTAAFFSGYSGETQARKIH
jgi:hypothetical protein